MPLGGVMTTDPKLTLRTLHEAAEYMKLKPRTLAKAARKLGACSQFGRELLFSEEDIKAIYEAHRVERTAPLQRIRPSLSEHQVSERLKKHLVKPKRGRS